MIKLINSKPSRGEIRYWAFAGQSIQGAVIVLLKVKIDNIKWDYENEYDIYYCKALDVIVDSLGDYTKGSSVIVDYSWQMQKTEEQARLLLIHTVLTKGQQAFFYKDPPF